MKPYEELVFTDDFMFCKILTTNPKLCKELLELVLGLKIRKIKIPVAQKSVGITYNARGIRLDVYVDDEAGTVYDMEMQTSKFADIPKRSRYYQGMIDLNILERGGSFRKLKKSYIIFFCTKDPFKANLPIYTFENICVQNRELKLMDDSIKVIVNPECDRTGLSEDMNSFLNLLQGKKQLKGIAEKIENEVTSAIKHNRWRLEYMTFAEKLQDEREEGRELGRQEGREEGKIDATVNDVEKLMRKMDISIENAMDMLEVKIEIRDEVLKHLSENK